MIVFTFFAIFHFLLTLALVKKINNLTASVAEGAMHFPKLERGSLAPDFEAQDLASQTTIALADYHNRAIAFIFFSSSCPPCREKIPALDTMQLENLSTHFELVLVSVDDDATLTRRFVDEFNVSFPVLSAPAETNPFMKTYKVPGTPYYCLIDRNGRILSSGFMENSWEKLIASWYSNEQ